MTTQPGVDEQVRRLRREVDDVRAEAAWSRRVRGWTALTLAATFAGVVSHGDGGAAVGGSGVQMALVLLSLATLGVGRETYRRAVGVLAGLSWVAVLALLLVSRTRVAAAAAEATTWSDAPEADPWTTGVLLLALAAGAGLAAGWLAAVRGDGDPRTGYLRD